MREKYKTKEMTDLFKAILTLENTEECYDFFEDLCTITELRSMSARFSVAKLLAENKTYVEIEQLTGASPSTIARINRCLEMGTGGYEKTLNRMKKD